jgi:hypothetical protein
MNCPENSRVLTERGDDRGRDLELWKAGVRHHDAVPRLHGEQVVADDGVAARFEGRGERRLSGSDAAQEADGRAAGRHGAPMEDGDPALVEDEAQDRAGQDDAQRGLVELRRTVEPHRVSTPQLESADVLEAEVDRTVHDDHPVRLRRSIRNGTELDGDIGAGAASHELGKSYRRCQLDSVDAIEIRACASARLRRWGFRRQGSSSVALTRGARPDARSSDPAQGRPV